MDLVEKIKTHFLFSHIFFRKSCRWWDNVEKYCRGGHATDDNMAHAHCMLDTWGYRYTLRMCNSYCISTARVVARTRLGVTLEVLCLPCCISSHLLFVLEQAGSTMTLCGLLERYLVRNSAGTPTTLTELPPRLPQFFAENAWKISCQTTTFFFHILFIGRYIDWVNGSLVKYTANK